MKFDLVEFLDYHSHFVVMILSMLSLIFFAKGNTLAGITFLVLGGAICSMKDGANKPKRRKK